MRNIRKELEAAESAPMEPAWPEDVLTAEELDVEMVASTFCKLSADAPHGWKLSTQDNMKARLAAMEHSFVVKKVAQHAPTTMWFDVIDGCHLRVRVQVLKLVNVQAEWALGKWNCVPDPVGRPAHSLWSLSRSTGRIVQIDRVYRSKKARDELDAPIYTLVNHVEVDETAERKARLVFNEVITTAGDAAGGKQVEVEVVSKGLFYALSGWGRTPATIETDVSISNAAQSA